MVEIKAIHEKLVKDMTGEEFQLMLINALALFQDENLKRMPEVMDKVFDSMVEGMDTLLPKVHQITEKADEVQRNL